MSLISKKKFIDEKDTNIIVQQSSLPENKNSSIKYINNTVNNLEVTNNIDPEMNLEIKVNNKEEDKTTENTINNNDDLVNTFAASKILYKNGRENSYFLGHRKEEKLATILNSEEININFSSEILQRERLYSNK